MLNILFCWKGYVLQKLKNEIALRTGLEYNTLLYTPV